MRLDKWLAQELGSRSAAQKAIAAGRVTVDGEPRPKSFEVTGTEAIEVADGEYGAYEAPHSPLPVEIVHEDEDFLVVDKAAGVIVHPAPGVRGTTLVDALRGRIAGGDDPERPGVVHRLDRDTSGLILFTRNQAAWERTNPRELRREYLALVKGRPPARAGTIDAPLGRDRRRRTLRSSDTDDPRPAVTHYVFEETFEDATLLRVRLETGRTHQIRAHLKAIGYPILGDPEYGAPYPGLQRQFLHAERLEDWHSPLPEDLAATLNAFRNPTPDAPSPVSSD